MKLFSFLWTQSFTRNISPEIAVSWGCSGKGSRKKSKSLTTLLNNGYEIFGVFWFWPIEIWTVYSGQRESFSLCLSVCVFLHLLSVKRLDKNIRNNIFLVNFLLLVFKRLASQSLFICPWKVLNYDLHSRRNHYFDWFYNSLSYQRTNSINNFILDWFFSFANTSRSLTYKKMGS